MCRLGLVISICFFIAVVVGCGGFGYAYEQRLAGNVVLVACDERKQMCVACIPEGDGNTYSTLIPETVFAAGWDEEHVIAKRHPREQPFDPIDKARTEYYIVVVRGEGVHGPFDQAEFAAHRAVLGVAKDLDFTLTFPDLE
jgi:hypothetical protein